jgi:hypothetical protein
MKISFGRGSYQRFNVVNRVLAVGIALDNCFVAMLYGVLEAAPQRTPDTQIER